MIFCQLDLFVFRIRGDLTKMKQLFMVQHSLFKNTSNSPVHDLCSNWIGRNEYGQLSFFGFINTTQRDGDDQKMNVDAGNIGNVDEIRFPIPPEPLLRMLHI